MAGLLALLPDWTADLLGDDPCNPTPFVCVAAPCRQPPIPDHCLMTTLPVPQRPQTITEALIQASDLPYGKNTCVAPDGRKFSCGSSIPCVTADGRQGNTTDYLGKVCEPIPDQVLSMAEVISGTGKGPSVKPWVVPAVAAALIFAAWRWS